MSSHLFVYVGVYLRVLFAPKLVPTTYPARCSENQSHPVTSNHKFCPECGAAVTPQFQEMVEMDEVPIDPNEFFENDRERSNDFWSPSSSFDAADSNEYVVWLINDTRSTMGCTIDEYGGYEDIEFNDQYPETSKKQFAEEYSTHLAALDAANIKYQICFGIVPYYN